MRLAFGFALLLVGLAFAGRADAQPPTDRPVSGPTIAASLAIAERFFDQQRPCDVRVFATSGDALARTVGLDPLRWVVDGLTDTPFVPEVSPCAIWVNTRHLTGRYGDRIVLCSDLVHEFGHMLGFAHDDKPGSVMNPGGHVVFACYRRFLPRGQGRAWRLDNPDAVWASRP